MLLNDNFNMAIASIRANRLRSLLTLLGIIIGVVSVITSVSLGEGLKRQVNQETSKLGNNVVTIRPGKVLNQDSSGLVSSINTLGNSTQTGAALSERDLAAIKDSQHVKSSAPLSLITGAPTYEGKSFNEAVIIGTSPNLPEMLSTEIEFGGFFHTHDANTTAAVIGPRVAEKLFGEHAPNGKSFSLRGSQFVVRGVMEDFETSALSQGIDLNNAIFIPYGLAKRLSGDTIQYYEILAKIDGTNNVQTAISSMRENVKKEHGGQEDFNILRASDPSATNSGVIDLVTTMVWAIAAISMLVGGIGIMNIMLVSVSERTREIGIRKAVGATDNQILSQFLVEAGTLSVWGAIIGVATSGIVNLLLRIYTDLQPVILWPIVIYVTIISILVGIIFGAAPAYKAAKKDPIEALRS